ncbi:MAG TPA: hypothetical protein VFW55_02185 [Propionicimonas sp.]|nr:hypothetical protein [Propionicimonas sp.]
MSDNVDEYGLGAPETQSGAPVPHDPRKDPLAHGLGGADVDHDHPEGEDFAEGGRQNKLEHGLAGAGSRDENLIPKGGKPDPMSHGLGSAGTGL